VEKDSKTRREGYPRQICGLIFIEARSKKTENGSILFVGANLIRRAAQIDLDLESIISGQH